MRKRKLFVIIFIVLNLMYLSFSQALNIWDAAASGDLERVKKLVEVVGIKVDSVKEVDDPETYLFKYKWTPFLEAMYSGKFKVAQYLIDKGANILSRTFDEKDKFGAAAWEGYAFANDSWIKNFDSLPDIEKIEKNKENLENMIFYIKFIKSVLLKKSNEINKILLSYLLFSISKIDYYDDEGSYIKKIYYVEVLKKALEINNSLGKSKIQFNEFAKYIKGIEEIDNTYFHNYIYDDIDKIKEIVKTGETLNRDCMTFFNANKITEYEILVNENKNKIKDLIKKYFFIQINLIDTDSEFNYLATYLSPEYIYEMLGKNYYDTHDNGFFKNAFLKKYPNIKDISRDMQ